MMDEERRSVPPAPGASALLVIFAVLCLTVLAMLSLSTVQADARLSDASAEAVAGYYAADYQAEEFLAQLREGTVPPGVREEAGVYYGSSPRIMSRISWTARSMTLMMHLTAARMPAARLLLHPRL